MDLAFTAPWALVGLLTLPLIWWLQKRLRRPPDVEVPSLMFLLDEDEARALPRGRLVDPELLLALTAAALLALGAADPVLGQRAPRSLVRVVVSGGASAGRTGYRDDVEATVASLRGALGAHDDLVVTWVPDGDGAGRRPTPAALLAAAQAGPASRRYVLSDREPPADRGAVTWVTLGRPAGSNTGFVGASVLPGADGATLFLTLAHQGASPARGEVLVTQGAARRAAPFSLAVDGAGSVRIPLPGDADEAPVRVRLATSEGAAWADDLAADDALVLERGPLRVAIDPTFPPALAARLRAGLAATLGAEGFVTSGRPALVFAQRAASEVEDVPTVVLRVAGEGEPVRAAPEGPWRVLTDPLVRDLAGAALDLRYGPGAERVEAGASVLLGVLAGDTLWPVVTRRDGVIRLVPDPLRGAPRLVDTPFWPLFVENVVASTGHTRAGEGYRAIGLLDPETSRTGTRRDTLDTADLRDLPAAIPGAARSLRPWLVAAALLCLLLLWGAPRLRRRLDDLHAARLRTRLGTTGSR